jgi:hypothetical protein
MKIRSALAVTAALGGGAVLTAAPALACGDTPGFCPNPPTSSNPDNGDYGVGVGGDW